MKELFRRLHYLLNRGRLERELAEDMEAHREMAARDGGRPFGNTLRLREEARDAWGWTWIDRLLQDVRYALRTLRASPGFSIAAVLMLAVGLAANVAAFGFFNLVVLRPLPIRDPDTLVRLHRRAPQQFASDLPYPAMAFYREHAKTLSAVLALSAARLTVESEEKQPTTHFVTGNFFAELGATAKLGRLLAASDEASSEGPVVVLSHGFWERHFGADPLVVGKRIRVNGQPATVVGVAPLAFSGLGKDNPALWLPLSQQPHFVHGSRLLTDLSGEDAGVDVWSRLRPGVTPRVAEEELRLLAAELRTRHPNDLWEGESVGCEPGGYAQNVGGRSRGTSPPESVRARLAPILALIGTLVLLILAVACGNLGSLLLARGVAREREIAIRIAVGAGTGRLIRQLFTESLVLAGIGSVVGLGLGSLVLRGLMVWTGAPPWLDPTPDGKVVLFAVGAGFSAAIFFGLTPALQIARQRHRAGISRQLLIGAQVASSCVLLIVAGLLVRALGRATSIDPGFEYQQVISIEPGLSAHGYSPAGSRAYLDALRERLGAIPGVLSVSLTLNPPLGRRRAVATTDVAEGRVLDIYLHRIEPPFFETMRIPLLLGRALRAGDAQAIVVSESLARQKWPGEEPLGKSFPLGANAAGVPLSYTVVGISGNARSLALKDPDAVELYQLAEPGDLASMTVLARTSGPAEGPAASMAAIAKGIDPQVEPEVRLLKTLFRGELENVERTAVAVSSFGSIALGLACLGIVGLVAYAVSQRAKEIGIRIALGARPEHVLLAVLRPFQRTLVVGLVVGIGLAAAVSQLLRRELYGVSHLDPASYLAAVGVFVVAAALAAVWPASRALRVDPMRALRCE